MSGKASIDLTGIRRAIGRVEQVKKAAAQASKRASVSVVRSIRRETARIVADVQLNLPANVISRHLDARLSDDTIVLSATKKRLPLMAFSPSIGPYGVRVTTFRARGMQHLPHAFLHKGKIKQRIPARGKGKNFESGPSGLVWRLPIINRVGPSMVRVLRPTGRFAADPQAGEVRRRVGAFAQSVLSAELARLLRVAA